MASPEAPDHRPVGRALNQAAQHGGHWDFAAGGVLAGGGFSASLAAAAHGGGQGLKIRSPAHVCPGAALIADAVPYS